MSHRLSWVSLYKPSGFEVLWTVRPSWLLLHEAGWACRLLLLASSMPYSSTMKTEAIYSSATLGFFSEPHGATTQRTVLFEDKVVFVHSYLVSMPRAGVCRVTYKTGFCIGWLYLLTPYSHNSGQQAIQLYWRSTHFTVHRYTRTRFSGLHWLYPGNGFITVPLSSLRSLISLLQFSRITFDCHLQNSTHFSTATNSNVKVKVTRDWRSVSQ
jgi:hypothetical protein